MSLDDDLELAGRHFAEGRTEAALALLSPWREVQEEPAAGRIRLLLGRVYLALGVEALVQARGDSGRGEARAHVRELTGGGPPEGDRLEAMRVQEVLDTLAACDWVQSAAAEALGISKFQMHRLLRKHGLLESVRDRRVTGP